MFILLYLLLCNVQPLTLCSNKYLEILTLICNN